MQLLGFTGSTSVIPTSRAAQRQEGHRQDQEQMWLEGGSEGSGKRPIWGWRLQFCSFYAFFCLLPQELWPRGERGGYWSQIC